MVKMHAISAQGLVLKFMGITFICWYNIRIMEVNIIEIDEPMKLVKEKEVNFGCSLS